MTKAAIYARLSNEKEASTSTKRQATECQQHAERLGLTVVETFIDEGISGYSGKHRPAFEEAVRQLEAGTFDTLIVWKLDRLTRQGMGAIGLLIDRLEGTGRRIVSVMDGVDTSNSQGRIMVALLSEMARSESANTSTRIKSAKREAREAGKWLQGNPPWGYVLDENRKLMHCPTNGKHARHVIEMMLAGATFSQVLDWLHENEVPSPRGAGWAKVTIANWLDSPAIAGLQVIREGRSSNVYRSPETGQPVSLGHGLATESEWQLIKKLRKQRRPKSGKRGESRSTRTLAGLVFCADCGGRMSVGVSWRCNNARTKRTCSGATIGEHLLEPYVENMMLTRITSLELDDPALVRVAEAWRGESAEVVNVSGLQDQLADLQARMDALLEDRYKKNRFAGREELFDSIVDDLTAEIESVKSQLVDAPSTNPTMHFVNFSDPEVVRMAWDLAMHGDKRSVAAALIDSVTVERRGLGAAFDPTRISVVWRD